MGGYGGSHCRSLCELDRFKQLWKPDRISQYDHSETGRYTNAFYCRRCSLRVAKEYAVGIGGNECPCCHYKMRSKRMAGRTHKAIRLGYDPRDKTRI